MKPFIALAFAAVTTAGTSAGERAYPRSDEHTSIRAYEHTNSLSHHVDRTKRIHRIVAATYPKLAIVQLQYGGGGDWYANPSGLPNLLRAIRERTGLDISDRPVQLKLTDPNLWSYPYIYITGHGNIHFTDEEVRILRKYLTSGGFLHVDDNYGLNESFRKEIKRVFPDIDLVELPADHAIYHAMYDLPKGLPKVHLHDGKPAQGFGIIHNGRVVVFYSYQSDLGNGWEDADRYNNAPEIREAALRMGVNLFVYAISQVTQ